MKLSLVPRLRCPICRAELRLVEACERWGEVEEGRLECLRRHSFPVMRFIPRFVGDDDYVDSFSFEWQIHRRTQLDSARGDRESTTRFQESLSFPLAELRGQRVLDVGCGMGRFVEVVADHGVDVVGVDLSFAVDAAFENLGRRPNVHLIQADVFALPLADAQFDLIYSLGVLHHTPDPRAAFSQLPRLLKPGGRISITLYSAYQKIFVYNSRFWRALTTRMPRRLLYALCHVAVPLYYVYRLPLLGQALRAVALISMHPDPRWRVLDTFDWYSPRYQSWHTHHEVAQWFRENGLVDIHVLEPGVSLIGRRPDGSDAVRGDVPPDRGARPRARRSAGAAARGR